MIWQFLLCGGAVAGTIKHDCKIIDTYLLKKTIAYSFVNIKKLKKFSYQKVQNGTIYTDTTGSIYFISMN